MTKSIRCAIYTRKSTEEGLEQKFNSLQAQREACEAYIRSQRGLGWIVVKKRYDDGGHSGGTLSRPALKSLLSDIENGAIDLIVVYKVDRLTRSLMDFARIIDTFDARSVSFVSVTQQFNTATSMGRLTLNVLLSFAQFEREVTGERIRDKIAASKKKGLWMGGLPPLGYDAVNKKLVVNVEEACVVRAIFHLYLQLKSVRELKREADARGYLTKKRRSGNLGTGGKPFTRGHLYQLLHNPIYIGKVRHKENLYRGEHEAIVDESIWDAVQTLLQQQAPARRSATNVQQSCLLTGIVFDEKDKRLSPSYSRKGKRHYRYYISNPRAQETAKDTGWRIPAAKLEGAIRQCLCQFLRDERRLVESLPVRQDHPDQIKAAIRSASKLARTIENAAEHESNETLRQWIKRCILSDCNISLELSGLVLGKAIGINCPHPDHTTTVNIPIAIRRRGVESKIILPGTSRASFRDPGLIRLIADAHRWFELITSGGAQTVRDIARKVQVDEGDVSRCLPLAFLAPDIIELILDGKQPPELTAEKLKRLHSLPKSWDEQRRVLAIAPSRSNTSP